MKFDHTKMCVVNDDGSKVNASFSTVTKFGQEGHDNITASVSGEKRFKAWLVKELLKTEGGLDGLYQVDGHYRSEKLDNK